MFAGEYFRRAAAARAAPVLPSGVSVDFSQATEEFPVSPTVALKSFFLPNSLIHLLSTPASFSVHIVLLPISILCACYPYG